MRSKIELFPENDKAIGKAITAYLKTKKITQVGLVDACYGNRINKDQLNRRLRGDNKISVGEYMAICEYLNVPYDYFMKGGKEDA